MILESIGDLPRADRAGPSLLLVLLVAAFIPSALMEFDASGVMSAIVDTLERMAPPVQTVLSGDLDQPAVPPETGYPAPRLSGEARPVRDTAGPVTKLGGRLPPPAGERGHGWPPGTSSSPRAPPATA